MSKHSRRLLSLGLIMAGISLALPVEASAQATATGRNLFSVRVSGGAGFALNGGGDIELERLGIGEYFNDIGSLTGYTTTTGWKKMSLVPDVELDFLFSLSSRFQIGVGTGYIRAGSSGPYSYDYAESGTLSWGTFSFTDEVNYTRDYVLSAIPIRLTFFANFPMGGKLSFYAYAGGAFYLGSLKHTYTMNETFFYEDFSSIYLDEKYEVTASAEGTETSKNNTFGAHGGLGLEMKLGSALSLGLEVFGRYASFSKWDGSLDETDTTRTRAYLEGQGWYSDATDTSTYSESGALWFYKYYDQDFGKSYAYMQTFSEQPAGDNVSSVRKGSLNLNTLGVRLTLKVYFNVI